MMKRIKAHTLVEILVVVALFALLFGTLFEILSSGRLSFNVGTTSVDVENQARLGLDSMVNELYLSNQSRVAIADDAVNAPPQESDTITFQIPTGYDGGGNLLWGAAGVANQQISYEIIANNQLVRKILDTGGNEIIASRRTLANDVTSLDFSQAGNLLTVSVVVRKNAIVGPTISKDLTSTLTFRN